jgi:hypothetical protein
VRQIGPHELLQPLTSRRSLRLEEEPVEAGAMSSEEVETPSALRRGYGVHPAEIIDADDLGA